MKKIFRLNHFIAFFCLFVFIRQHPVPLNRMLSPQTAFKSSYNKIHLVCIIGGTKLRFGVLSENGTVLDFSSRKWAELDSGKKTRKAIIEQFVRLILEKRKQFRLEKQKVLAIGISWAGMVSDDHRHVIGNNIAGFKVRNLSQKMIDKGGYPLAAALEIALARKGLKAEVSIIQDAEAAALGEYYQRYGRAKPVKKKISFIKRKINQLGYYFVRVVKRISKGKKEYGYEFRPPEDRLPPFPAIDLSKDEIYGGYLFCGPNIAKRYVDKLLETKSPSEVRKWLNMEDQSIGKILSVFRLNKTRVNYPRKVIGNRVLIERIHKVITKKLNEKDPLTLLFAQEIETDIGQFLKAVLGKFPKGYFLGVILGTGVSVGFIELDDKNRDTQILLCGGVSEHFHLPRTDKEGDDFIQRIQEVSGSAQILRSKLSAERDLFAFLPHQGAAQRSEQGSKRIAISA